LTSILNLGEQHLSDFREDDTKPPTYPLEAVICGGCKLVQLRHSTPQHEMYHDRYGFKSGVSNSIKDDLRDVVMHAQRYKNSPKNWLDIASNDGTLLGYVPTSGYKVGVDPVGFLCREAEEHADLIINDYFGREALKNHTLPYFDVITSISCFYDMPDPSKFVADVESVLAEDGVWVIQQNYLLATIQLNAIDNFCHEHLEYYTLFSLEKLLEEHGLEVFDVETSTVNGGSIRTLVCKRGAFPVEPSVERQRRMEIEAKVENLQTYIDFGKNAMGKVDHLREVVGRLNSEGKRVAILAASTRGATIWQAAGFTKTDIVYAIERNPAKVGKYFSAIGIPIVSEEFARADQPDVEIIGPWFFADEIIKREQGYVKKGGCLIVPLPDMRFIDASDISSDL
jgi:NDP-4-keto-2,6-dideoxyhexose 3-C-methyltransferase